MKPPRPLARDPRASRFLSMFADAVRHGLPLKETGPGDPAEAAAVLAEVLDSAKDHPDELTAVLDALEDVLDETAHDHGPTRRAVARSLRPCDPHFFG